MSGMLSDDKAAVGDADFMAVEDFDLPDNLMIALSAANVCASPELAVLRAATAAHAGRAMAREERA